MVVLKLLETAREEGESINHYAPEEREQKIVHWQMQRKTETPFTCWSRTALEAAVQL